MWVYVGVCGRMWGNVCEPNHLSGGMVHGSYVGVCGAYVGVCGRVCVNQNVISKTFKFACMWECMWAYVGVCGCMWGRMWAYVGVCGRMWTYVNRATLEPDP